MAHEDPRGDARNDQQHGDAADHERRAVRRGRRCEWRRIALRFLLSEQRDLHIRIGNVGRRLVARIRRRRIRRDRRERRIADRRRARIRRSFARRGCRAGALARCREAHAAIGAVTQARLVLEAAFGAHVGSAVGGAAHAGNRRKGGSAGAAELCFLPVFGPAHRAELRHSIGLRAPSDGRTTIPRFVGSRNLVRPAVRSGQCAALRA